MFILKTHQYKTLGEIERQNFCLKMIQFILKHFNQIQSSSINEPIDQYVDDLCKSGIEIGLRTEREISKFIILNIALGKNFINTQKFENLKRDLVARNLDCEELLDLVLKNNIVK